MKAEQYFTENAADIRKCYAAELVDARKLSAGDSYAETTGFVPMMTSAPESGWEVSAGQNSSFVSDAEFAKLFVAETVLPTLDLPEGAKVEQVAKGDEIYTNIVLPVLGTAEQAGFLVTLPEDGKTRFMSDSKFRATFKSSAAPVETKDGLFRYIPQSDELPVGYVVLKEETQLDFISGPYIASAGSVLFENISDEDGYTLLSTKAFSESFIPAEKVLSAQQNAKLPAPGLK